jgi:hypothetical protein
VRTKGSCWSVGTIYDPRELTEVSTSGPGIGRGVTSGIRADPRGFMGVCGFGVRVYGAWCMWARSGHMAWHMKFSWVCMSEDKVRTKGSCWSMRTIYDPRELPEVSTSGPGIGRGVTSGIRADPRGFMGVCELGVRVYGAWCMWARSGHMAWHMTTLDTHTWLREEVPGLVLTDEDVGLLRGWIVIS